MIGGLRSRLARLLGRCPPDMQVAALCIEARTGKVLLITSRGTGRWVLPKGWPMAGRSLADAAQQEAWEEAGVTGHVSQTEIGRFHYDKEQDRGFAIPVEVRVFALHVDQLESPFPESGERQRRWFSPTDAARLVAEPGLQQILRDLRPQQAD